MNTAHLGRQGRCEPRMKEQVPLTLLSKEGPTSTSQAQPTASFPSSDRACREALCRDLQPPRWALQSVSSSHCVSLWACGHLGCPHRSPGGRQGSPPRRRL